MFESSPNGYFVRDLVVFHGLRKGCYVSKGFVIEPADLSAAAPEHLNAFQDQLAFLLSCLHDKLRLQVQWFCDSDYRSELLRYREQTERATNVWTRRCRNERFARYWQAMVDRRLRRQRLVLYFSRQIETSPALMATAARQHAHYDALVQEMTTEFELVRQMLANIFHGARITPMNDADHFRNCTTFLNPSLGARFDYDTLATFDPQLSIQENCWHSEAQGLQDGSGFWMDGFYHSVLVLNRWPKMTHPGLVHRLTGLPLLDYNITVNIESLSARAEINREEKAHDRLAGDFASEKRLSLLTAMEKKQKKIAALMQGHTLPFNIEYIIRAWDQTREGLAVKMAAIKNAINGMNGAQYLECALPTTAKKLFYQSWPGCPWGRYPHRKLYAETRYLADVLPFSATFTGHLDQAEALYEGNSTKSRRRDHVRRLRRKRNAATRGLARHERRGKKRHRLRSAFADRSVLRLHRHHRGRTLVRNLHAHGRTERATDHHSAGWRSNDQLSRHARSAAHGRATRIRDGACRQDRRRQQ